MVDSQGSDVTQQLLPRLLTRMDHLEYKLIRDQSADVQCTREELEGFCVYVTDAPAVPPQGIKIDPKSMGHILIGSHTCFSTLDLNVDDIEGGREEWLQSFSMNVLDQEYSQT